MKRITLYIIGMAMFLGSFAQTPKWYKKINQIQVTVYTWDTKGTMHEAPGVYLDNSGRVATQYDVMKGAVKASVTDSKGKDWPVMSIEGASSLYNVCTLITKAQKNVCAPLAVAMPTKGDMVYLLYDVKTKSVVADADTLMDVQQFNEVYNYSTLTKVPTERQIGCPAMNVEGQLLGIIQAPSQKDKPGYVLDARYAESLHISALDATRSDYKDIGIRKSLPTNEKDALTFLYLSSRTDTAAYISMLDEYIAKYPTVSQVYSLKAEILAGEGKYAEAESTMTNALTVSGMAKDEVYYSLGNLMMRCVSGDKNNGCTWTLDNALTNIRQAYSINPLPLYSSQEANILYAQKKYSEAEEKFLALNNTNMRSVENYLRAAQCREMRGDSIQAIIALQDSALAMYSQPYPKEAAPVLLMRAISNTKAGYRRQAISDYNTYEHLAGSESLTYLFYYQREQLEVQCRMYAPALNDIERAIKLKDNDPLLYAEEASVNYIVGHNQEAELAARTAVRVDEKFADAWRILGVILRAEGKKTEAVKALQKAADLGDEVAKKLLLQES